VYVATIQVSDRVSPFGVVIIRYAFTANRLLQHIVALLESVRDQLRMTASDLVACTSAVLTSLTSLGTDFA
jgi:hypothetical protein